MLAIMVIASDLKTRNIIPRDAPHKQVNNISPGSADIRDGMPERYANANAADVTVIASHISHPVLNRINKEHARQYSSATPPHK
jgi:hypothetical protein